MGVSPFPGVQEGYQEEVTKRFGFQPETDVCRPIFLNSPRVFRSLLVQIAGFRQAIRCQSRSLALDPALNAATPKSYFGCSTTRCLFNEAKH
jgi:hypothetical protein